jgi:hypothetical protein
MYLVVINYFLASKNILENVNWKSKKCTNISKTKKSRKSSAAILKPTEQPIATKRLTIEKSEKNNLFFDAEWLARRNKTIVRKTDMKKPVIVNDDSRGPSTKNADACSVDEEVIHKTLSVERFVTVQQKHKCNINGFDLVHSIRRTVAKGPFCPSLGKFKRNPLKVQIY